MTEALILQKRKQDRHRYYAIGGENVVDAIAGLMGLAEKAGLTRTPTGRRDAALRTARSCYNYLAGDMGVRLFDALYGRGYLSRSGEDLRLTDSGCNFLTDFGIDFSVLDQKTSPMCRECLDWSACRSHLSDNLGRAILDRLIEQNWAARDTNSRAVIFSERGKAAFIDISG